MKLKEKAAILEQGNESIRKQLFAFFERDFAGRQATASDTLSQIIGTMLFVDENLNEDAPLTKAWETRK